jgi:hypothetical protein
MSHFAAAVAVVTFSMVTPDGCHALKLNMQPQEQQRLWLQAQLVSSGAQAESAFPALQLKSEASDADDESRSRSATNICHSKEVTTRWPSLLSRKRNKNARGNGAEVVLEPPSELRTTPKVMEIYTLPEDVNILERANFVPAENVRARSSYLDEMLWEVMQQMGDEWNTYLDENNIISSKYAAAFATFKNAVCFTTDNKSASEYVSHKLRLFKLVCGAAGHAAPQTSLTAVLRATPVNLSNQAVNVEASANVPQPQRELKEYSGYLFDIAVQGLENSNIMLYKELGGKEGADEEVVIGAYTKVLAQMIKEKTFFPIL